MKFSVVIPLYNKQRFIQKTLTLVLAQDFKDFEIIIIDDGSTDCSAELANQVLFGYRNWQLIRQSNAGVSAARNHGIAVAKGEWIVFLDADDFWHSSYLSVQYDLICRFPEISMVATSMRAVSEHLVHTVTDWPQSNLSGDVEIIADLPRRWSRGLPMITSCVAVRSETLKALQPCFHEGESNGEDIELWFRLSAYTPIARTSIVLVAYTEAPTGGLTLTNSPLNEAPYLQRLLDRSQMDSTQRKFRSSILSFVGQQRVTLARRNLEHGQRMVALQLLMRAWPVAFSHRWLVTLLMTATFPRTLVSRWDKWRALQKSFYV